VIVTSRAPGTFVSALVVLSNNLRGSGRLVPHRDLVDNQEARPQAVARRRVGGENLEHLPAGARAHPETVHGQRAAKLRRSARVAIDRVEQQAALMAVAC
jgi:hypothetical protein